MSISYRVDPESGIVYVTTSGTPSAREQRDLWGSLGGITSTDAPLRLLDDRRGLESFAEPSEVREASAFAAKFVEALRGARIATVVPQEVAFGMSRMFQAYSDPLPLEHRAFYDYDEAERWLLDVCEPEVPEEWR